MADIHHHQNSDDSFGNQNKVEVEETQHSLATSSQNRNERTGPIVGFGLQALGPLSAKSALANIKFHGRQFQNLPFNICYAKFFQCNALQNYFN